MLLPLSSDNFLRLSSLALSGLITNRPLDLGAGVLRVVSMHLRKTPGRNL